MNMKQLLDKIAKGQMSFQPVSNSVSDMQLFQGIATLIFEAEKLGYITDVIPHQESDTGNDYFDEVVVGGLTEKGHHAKYWP